MRSFASRIRMTPVVTVALLAAVVVALVGIAATQFGSNYSDGGAKVVQLASHDLAAVANKTYLIDCGHQPVVRPKLYTLTCGDANVGLDHLVWSGWGGADAKATARYIENTCTPYCAAGHYLYLPAKVVAHGLKRKAGTAIYTSITVIFPKGQPSWVHGHRTTFDVAPLSR